MILSRKKRERPDNPWRFLTFGDKIFLNINDFLLLIGMIIVLYPLVYIVSSSFSSPAAVAAGRVRLLPIEPTLAGYIAVFEHHAIGIGYMNSIIYTVVGTTVNLIMTVLVAYPLSRARMPGKNLITFLFVFTMIFSGGLIPMYLLNMNLGLVDTRAVMILPNAIGVFNMIICRTFFAGNIPEDLNEAAQIDGCDHIRFLVSIALPLSKPILAVLALFYGVGHWNAFFDAFIYLSSRDLFPLQLVLREILLLGQVADVVGDPEALVAMLGLAQLLRFSLIVCASLPFMLVYPFVAKHFVKGALTGAIKG